MDGSNPPVERSDPQEPKRTQEKQHELPTGETRGNIKRNLPTLCIQIGQDVKANAVILVATWLIVEMPHPQILYRDSNKSPSLTNQRWCKKIRNKNGHLHSRPTLESILVYRQNFTKTILLYSSSQYSVHAISHTYVVIRSLKSITPMFVTRPHVNNSYRDKSTYQLAQQPPTIDPVEADHKLEQGTDRSESQINQC